MRLFVLDDTGFSELTDGDDQRIVRVSASDLQQARRACRRVRDQVGGPAAVLDVAVAVADDYRAARRAIGAAAPGTVQYAGTVDGLVGLIADIDSAGVADGVTLIAATPQQDVVALSRQVLDRLPLRSPAR
ncbi:hypothetical protein ACAG25_12415 [Mycobacterium sp. pV006]|uniref:hypothetical protein n=1 Tax=Mycobacterium sp. pV006 TaxID=3238983 RepID=UPI00351BDC82